MPTGGSIPGYLNYLPEGNPCTVPMATGDTRPSPLQTIKEERPGNERRDVPEGNLTSLQTAVIKPTSTYSQIPPFKVEKPCSNRGDVPEGNPANAQISVKDTKPNPQIQTFKMEKTCSANEDVPEGNPANPQMSVKDTKPTNSQIQSFKVEKTCSANGVACIPGYVSSVPETKPSIKTEKMNSSTKGAVSELSLCSAVHSGAHTVNTDAVQKRQIRLMKNREAARECRRKKKEYVRCLENRVAILEHQNKTLIEELRAIKEIYRHQ